MKATPGGNSSLVRAETFPSPLLATTTSPLISCHNNYIIIPLRLLYHDTLCAKRKMLEAKPRSIDICALRGGAHGRCLCSAWSPQNYAASSACPSLRQPGRAASRSSDAVSTTSSSRGVVRRTPRPRRRGVRPVVTKSRVGCVVDVPMARRRMDTPRGGEGVLEMPP